MSAKDEAEEIGRVRTALLATLAGTVAVVGAVFTGLSYRLSRAGQITERFTRAIDQLGNADIDVRLGGIYALERIARDSKDDHPQITEVLTAYIREHAPWPPKASPATKAEPRSDTLVALSEAIQALGRIARATEPEAVASATTDEPANESGEAQTSLPTDVQAAMSVLGRRTASHDRPGAHLNLSATDLRRVVIHHDEAHLELAELAGAHLEGADLLGAHLEDIYAPGAHLERANLAGVHFERANLARAHFEGAALNTADLTRASLEGAHLEDTNANAADLKHAYLPKAHLERASLGWAQLEGANLEGAHLEGADLDRAQLEGAHLDGANLEGASLHMTHLRGTYYNDDTRWPDEFDYRAAGARHVMDFDWPDSVAPST